MISASITVDFHDAKGELLHQALMPKKMAKLDESPDFRPFKFRIQAFTNAFAEEVSRQHEAARAHEAYRFPFTAAASGSPRRDVVCKEDKIISLEPEADLSLQRRWQKVQEQGESHLECGREEDAGRVVDLPTVPKEDRSTTTDTSLHRDGIQLDT